MTPPKTAPRSRRMIISVSESIKNYNNFSRINALIKCRRLYGCIYGHRDKETEPPE
ncbi:MAG TPA: hypothetical protein DDX12_00625 [Nitrospiraceae bacterium]|nr:hypothetical protein [Nitrospiraceae bacterium]HBU05825.1 hypothetical protein [Nitrospiraceae bacterium]